MDCPKEKDWSVLWPPQKESFGPKANCFIDDIRAYQSGQALNSPPGTEIRMGKCPPKNLEDKWPGGYDWRYGGIRPQDNPDMALYPEVKKHIEALYEKSEKPVVVSGYSGGTINSYAFLMSQTLAWRQKYVLAHVQKNPVFGGTISSINSVLHGWARGAMDICSGRKAAMFIPSVLWMWPRPGENEWAWNKTEIVVYTASKNYTAYDLPQMLTDMGLPKVRALLELEIPDYLDKFQSPGIDTYAVYGYDKATQGFFHRKEDFSPETDGPDVCPTPNFAAGANAWDNGDGVGTLRSTSRASQWKDELTKAGKVLKNYGFKGMGHSCTGACTAIYKCIEDKLNGKPNPAIGKDC